MENSKEYIQQTFETYVSAYDLSDPKIKLKDIHTRKVAENAECIACSLDLSWEDQMLCWTIGMLHDIGRFEQLRRYDTFMDSESIDHADFGADLLFQEGLIDRFHLDAANFGEIEVAIRNHSRYCLPEGLSEREYMLCQILRDADKVDIFRANYETGMDKIYNVTMEELENAEITPEVYDAFMEGHTVVRSLKRTPVDHLVGHLSLTWELIYPESRKLTARQGYMWKLAQFQSENPKCREQLAKIRERLTDFQLQYE